MFSSVRRYFRRNKRSLFVGTSVVAVLYFTFGYLRKKFIEYQLKLTEERFSREQIRRRFEQTQKDALYTIYALVPVLSAPILESLPVESITRSLQARRLEKRGGNGVASLNGDDISSTTTESVLQPNSKDEIRKTKNELWSELKSASLTRLLTLIYSNALLILFTRLQLNILARREYLDDALKLAASKHGFSDINKKIDLVDKTLNDQENYVNEQAYLSFSWWLLNRGWVQIKERVKVAVDEVFQDINPRVELSLDDFANLLNKTQQLIENSDDGFLTSILLPPSNLETFVIQQTLDDESLKSLNSVDSTDGSSKFKDNLRILLDETSSYINSSSSLIVLSSEVNIGISTFLNYIALSLSSKQDVEEIKPNEIKVKLAVLLANTTKAANDFRNSSSSVGNDYINNMDKVLELDELSASVYSNFDI